MNLIKIQPEDKSLINEIYNSYCSSFPEDERRNEKQFFDLFTTEKAEILSVVFEEKNVGYLIIWKLENDIVFVEHFEVFPQYRNMKLGSKILEKLHQEFSKLVLESEPAELNEIAERRINFYKRNGFEVIDENYIQPAYDKTKNSMNLWLLSSFTPKETKELSEKIHSTVYNS